VIWEAAATNAVLHSGPATRPVGGDHKLCVGCQIRQQFTLIVVGVDFDGVSDDVLFIVALSRILPTRPGILVGKRVHGKRYRLVFKNVAYVGFVDRHPDLNALEVFRNEKQARGTQA